MKKYLKINLLLMSLSTVAGQSASADLWRCCYTAVSSIASGRDYCSLESTVPEAQQAAYNACYASGEGQFVRCVYHGCDKIGGWRSSEVDAKCKAYDHEGFFKNREDIIRIFGEGGRGGFFHAGTKGGGGPGLHIHPQLIIKPEE